MLLECLAALASETFTRSASAGILTSGATLCVSVCADVVTRIAFDGRSLVSSVDLLVKRRVLGRSQAMLCGPSHPLANGPHQQLP